MWFQKTTQHLFTPGPWLLRIWCSFHLWAFSKKFKHGWLMQFSLQEFLYSYSFSYTLVTNNFTLVDLVHEDFCQTQKMSKPRTGRIIYLKVWWYRMIVFSKIVFSYLEFKVWWLHWICKVQVSFVDYFTVCSDLRVWKLMLLAININPQTNV